jgi:hypothetical protein
MAFNLLSLIRRLPINRPITPIEHDKNLVDNLAKNLELLKQELELRTPTVSDGGGFSIKMFSGPTSDLGWVGSTYQNPSNVQWRSYGLCDGGSFTVPGIGAVTLPNLTDKFIVGAGNSYAVGGDGGTASNSHNHGGSTGEHTLLLDEIPDHSHTSFTSGAVYVSKADRGDATRHVLIQNAAAQELGEYSGNTGGVNSHTGILGHDHTIGQANLDNRPPYYALCYVAFVGYLHS